MGEKKEKGALTFWRPHKQLHKKEKWLTEQRFHFKEMHLDTEYILFTILDVNIKKVYRVIFIFNLIELKWDLPWDSKQRHDPSSPFLFKICCLVKLKNSNIITWFELKIKSVPFDIPSQHTIGDSKKRQVKPFFPQVILPHLHFIILKKIGSFLKSASWTDILLLFWMSHCLSVHGREDFEWCWMFYDSPASVSLLPTAVQRLW